MRGQRDDPQKSTVLMKLLFLPLNSQQRKSIFAANRELLMPDLKIFVSEEKERGKGPLGQMVSSLHGKENS